MNVRQLLARTPADLEAEKRQLEKEAFLDATERASRSRHGRRSRRPAWQLRYLGKDSRMAEWRAAQKRPAPEPSGRAWHLAYRAAKRRAASR